MVVVVASGKVIYRFSGNSVKPIIVKLHCHVSIISNHQRLQHFENHNKVTYNKVNWKSDTCKTFNAAKPRENCTIPENFAKDNDY